MTLNLSMPGQEELKPRITVFGVGGAGGNAVNNMIEKALDGVDFVVANTDAQALQQARAQSRVQLGVKVTEGLGAGARPSVGAKAAEESIEQIVDHLAGAHAAAGEDRLTLMPGPFCTMVAESCPTEPAIASGPGDARTEFLCSASRPLLRTLKAEVK